jgi:hypothetical protein
LRSWENLEDDQTTEDDVKTCNNYNSENGKQRKSFEVATGKYLNYRRKKNQKYSGFLFWNSEVRRKWHNIFRHWKKKIQNQSTKFNNIHFRKEEEIRTFSDEVQIREFVECAPILKNL